MNTETTETLALVKLTKKAVSDFLQWSTSRYNNYCGYGTKKQNVERVYQSLCEGHDVGFHLIAPDSTRFTVECASGVGENGSGRYWRTKQGGDKYHVDCEARTITAEYSKRTIQFQ